MVHSQGEINTRRGKKRFLTSGEKENNAGHAQSEYSCQHFRSRRRKLCTLRALNPAVVGKHEKVIKRVQITLRHRWILVQSVLRAWRSGRKFLQYAHAFCMG